MLGFIKEVRQYLGRSAFLGILARSGSDIRSTNHNKLRRFYKA